MDEAVISYIQARQVVEPKVEGRIATKPATAIYIVKPGDVLWWIAKQYGTTWEKLQEINKLKNPHLISPGQEIIVPAQ